MSVYAFKTIDPTGSIFSSAHDINNKGQVVGYYNTTSSSSAFLYSDGSFGSFTPSNSDLTLATGINDSGQAVGYYFGNTASNGNVLGFETYNYASYFTSRIQYTGINNTGTVVGNLPGTYSPSTLPVIVDAAGNMKYLPMASQASGGMFVQAINDKDAVVGYYYDNNNSQHGFLYTGGTYGLPIDAPSGYNTRIYGINNNNSWVGSYTVAGLNRGYVRDFNGYTDINYPGARLTEAFGINDAGLVVGDYSDAAGVTHAFLATPLTQARSDLNGDGTKDILFQSGGSLVSWSMQNGAYAGSTDFGNQGAYTAKATGDFNGDGTGDILFQDASGNVVGWRMQNGQVAAGTVVGRASGYSVVGSGDFNGDGTDDVLFRNNATGAVVTWTMQNGQATVGTEIGQAGGYTVAGVGDFNGDGTDDILLQNGSSVVEWIMGQGRITDGRVVGNAGNYRVAGVGDLNGDGTADIALQSGGSVVEWLMGQGQITAGRQLGGDAGNNFQVTAVEDYTGDGTADVLFKGGDGSVVAWTVQNGQVTAGNLVGMAGSYNVIG